MHRLDRKPSRKKSINRHCHEWKSQSTRLSIDSLLAFFLANRVTTNSIAAMIHEVSGNAFVLFLMIRVKFLPCFLHYWCMRNVYWLYVCMLYWYACAVCCIQVEKSFLQNEGKYKDGLKHQKRRNKGSLHSKDAHSYTWHHPYIFVSY